MADAFAEAVQHGLVISKRVYFGHDRAISPPKPVPPMKNSLQVEKNIYLPTGPMVYVLISDPGIVDNPDNPTYQPYVYGRCVPPVLIPMHMTNVELEVDCFLDRVFVTMLGSWRVHCVKGSKSCPCVVAIPMGGEEGSILGVEVDTFRKACYTQEIALDNRKDHVKDREPENGQFIRPHIYTFTIPQVDGGSILSLKVCWSKKLAYRHGDFCLNIPFVFPEYVTPPGKKIPKKEKIQLRIKCGPETEILCKNTSHPLKELRRQAGELDFLYESEVLKWSRSDLTVSYSVHLGHISGGVFLQSPSTLDSDQRDMFCLFLFPGRQLCQKVFRREVIFLVDISGSMRGKLLDDTKTALSAALAKLDSKDKFNIIAFNTETFLYSSNMESATQEAIAEAIEWIHTNFIVGDGTNILLPLNRAVEMLSEVRDSVPMIFLITDGTLEDERQICDAMKNQLADLGSSPRIHSFGIGTYCNHYFLLTLSMFGRGYYDAAYNPDSIVDRMEAFFSRASFTVAANIAVANMDNLDELQVYPSRIPDLQAEIPLIVSGRFKGKFPDTIRARGILADMSSFTEDLKVKMAKDIPLDKVLIKNQIDLLTAEAWFSGKKELEVKIAEMSIRSGFASEYTTKILLEEQKRDEMSESIGGEKEKLEESNSRNIVRLRHTGIGFGNLAATIENLPPGLEKERLPVAAEMYVKVASNCCDHCCCMCCVRSCGHTNNQCVTALTQFFACLACFACCDSCCPSSNRK